MPVQLICCSHSPLMTTGIEESEQGVQGQFFREMDACAEALHKFSPDLVVVFGPDHFNGFFYELMPTFCIGTAAEATAAELSVRARAPGAAPLVPPPARGTKLVVIGGRAAPWKPTWSASAGR